MSRVSGQGMWQGVIVIGEVEAHDEFAKEMLTNPSLPNARKFNQHVF